ncbi:MAG: tetratricopeptide repeat protein [Bacteroidota bacterium]
MRIWRFIGLCLSLAFLWLPLQADEGEASFLWQKANQAYEQGAFPQAIQLYDSILSLGYEAADLHYNLGNAHFKAKQVAPSIFHYEKALQLEPGHADARVNLKQANQRVMDNIDPMPELLFLSWIKKTYYRLTESNWATLALILLWIALGGGSLFLFSQSPLWKRIGFFSGLVLLSLSVSALLISLSKRTQAADAQEGIIFAQNTYVKNAPNGETNLLVLHEGVKVEVVEAATDGWVKIRLEGIKVGEVVGFIPQKDIQGL